VKPSTRYRGRWVLPSSVECSMVADELLKPIVNKVRDQKIIYSEGMTNAKDQEGWFRQPTDVSFRLLSDRCFKLPFDLLTHNFTTTSKLNNLRKIIAGAIKCLK
jgi:hypothetical protein